LRKLIWFNRPTAEFLNDLHRNTACEALGMTITEIGDDYLRGTMPVDHRTVQVVGLLHGGASIALAETLASAAANACVDPDLYTCVGTNMNANHIRAVSNGVVTGTARPLHMGRTSHLWEIDVLNAAGKPVCLARLATSVISLETLQRTS
jgi:1,4-dihydroxy-2-naphthoyl-CoA hydrolase